MNDMPSSRAVEIEARLVRLTQIEPVLASGYLVKNWLTPKSFSMIYGPSNAGKTFVALDIAMHIAACLPWRCCPVVGGPVVYVAAEGGAGIRNRLAAIKVTRPEMADAPFVLLPIGLDLHGNGDALAICEAMPFEAPAMIVIDTLARSMGSGDENTAKDAAAFVRNCDLIREATGAHVMVVHHTGKDQDRGARGSSALRGAVDTEIAVTDQGEIICKKQRDLIIGAPLHFVLRTVELGHDSDGDPVTSAVVDVGKAPPRKPPKPLTGKNEVAMSALLESMSKNGEIRTGSEYPAKCKVVSVTHWRAACDAHGLTDGTSDSAARTAFKRAKDKLIDLDQVRQYGDHVWQVQTNV